MPPPLRRPQAAVGGGGGGGMAPPPLGGPSGTVCCPSTATAPPAPMIPSPPSIITCFCATPASDSPPPVAASAAALFRPRFSFTSLLNDPSCLATLSDFSRAYATLSGRPKNTKPSSAYTAAVAADTSSKITHAWPRRPSRRRVMISRIYF